MTPTSALVNQLKNNGQDHEFYPTTDKIIGVVRSHLEKAHNSDDSYCSILDCGAGDGRVLAALTKGDKYAIEKSEMLITAMDESIFVVGCEFFENTLIDKKVDVVFCNPPYSQYKEWTLKLIREANAPDLFLVIPERWKEQPEILAAIKDREAEFEIIGNTDFLEADRPARAKVDIIKISLQRSRHYYSKNNEPDIDPFKLWVEKEFPLDERKADGPAMTAEESFAKKLNELVPGRGLVPALVKLYQNEMAVLQDNFRAISKIDRSLFDELKIDFSSITEFLRTRIVGLKEKYWRELFSNLEPITSRLTVSSRKELLETLTENISVDFNESNIYAVTTWAIKNANKYFDSQLIDVFVGLVERANLIAYKSNQKTWGNDDWRFREEMREGKIKHFGLDYRCIISCYTTFSDSSFKDYDYPNGLNRSVHDKLNDIITVAHNLGFICPSWETSHNKEWSPGKTQDFYMNRMEKDENLMSVKAYKNGNLHIKFNQKFLRQLNVEFGRLKGWLRNHKQAADELNIPEHEAKEYFKTNFALECSSTKLLQIAV